MFRYFVPSLLWMAVIFFLSSRTGNQLHDAFPFMPDFNWGHLVAYFILAVTFYFGLERGTNLQTPFWWSVIFAVIYGLTDEFHQSFVPGRSPEVGDLINDTIGAMLGAFFYKRKLSAFLAQSK